MASATTILVVLIGLQWTVNCSVLRADEFSANNWWDDAQLYQVYPRSFKDSDGNGIGDLNGITSKLDYFKSIGVNAFWMNPMFQSPQKDDGYDIEDYRQVHKEYGNMTDFEALIKKANELEIRVLLDLVPNHSSDKHEWFQKSVMKESKYTDYYTWHDGKTDDDGNRSPPNNWRSVFGGSAWTLNKERNQYYYHQFFAEQPDLNYRNPEVVKEMKEVMTYWLEKGVAGFRIDAFNHMFEDQKFLDEEINPWITDPNAYDYTNHIYTKDLPECYDMIYEFRKHVDQYAIEKKSERKFMMTEAFASITDTMKYYVSEDGTKLGSLPYNDRLINLDGRTEAVTAQKIKSNIDGWLDYMPDKFHTNWPTGSHDAPRAGTRLGPDMIGIINTINQLIPGASITYYGDEIGMVDAPLVDPVDHRHPCRTPMQWSNGTSAGFSSGETLWLPINENYKTVNVDAQNDQQRSHLKHYIELSKLRKHKTFRNGDLRMKSLSKDVFAFTRELKGEPTYLVVVNLSKDEKNIDLTSFNRLDEQLKIVSAVARSKHVNDHMVDTHNVTLAAFDGIVLESSSANALRYAALSLVLVVIGNLVHLF